MNFLRHKKTYTTKILITLSVIALMASSAVFATISTADAQPPVETTIRVENAEEDVWIVPEGVTEVSVTLVGGSGENGENECGGQAGEGAKLVGTLSVSPGQELTLVAGLHGEDVGTHMQGGESGGGNGGAASLVFIGETTLGNLVLAAAGGGGGGASSIPLQECPEYEIGRGGDALANGLNGGNGDDGDDGEGGPVGGGQGGSEYTGEGGQGPVDGQAGHSGIIGGNGGNEAPEATSPAGGGAGGGGYRPGGGGAGGYYSGGGGGAGASYINEELFSDYDTTDGDGETPRVVLKYEEPPVTTEPATSSSTPTTSAPASSGPDSDGDGRADSIEDGAPNNGDGNNDGIADSLQENVSSFISEATGKYVTVVNNSTATCVNEKVGVVSESDATDDNEYSYPNGLLAFELACQETGASVTMELIFFDAGDAKTFVGRKFVNETFQTLEGSKVENVSIGDANAVKLTYSLTDGGPLDIDGEANGTIIDPAGLGVRAGELPSTGSNSLPLILSSVVMVLSGAILAASFKRRRLL